MLKRILFLLLIILLIGAAGFVGYFLGKNNLSLSNYSIKLIRASQNGLVNPLIDYQIDSGLYVNALKNFKTDVNQVVSQKLQDGKADEIAVYFKSLNSGGWFGIQEDQNFFPASLLKLPIAVAYYKWSEEDPTILKKEISYQDSTAKILEDFNTSEHYKPDNPIEVGQTYTVEQLIEKMIIESDNNAKNLLVLNFDSEDRYLRVYTDLGLAEAPELMGNQPSLSVHAYSAFYSVLYNASYLNKGDSNKVLSLLTQTKFNLGLTSKLPANIEVAHKFGEYGDANGAFIQLHDCGIVYYPSYPYMACIMTRGHDYQSLEGVIQDISLSIYQQIDKQIKSGKNR